MQCYFWTVLTINLFFQSEKRILLYHMSTQKLKKLKSFNEINYQLKNYLLNLT